MLARCLADARTQFGPPGRNEDPGWPDGIPVAIPSIGGQSRGDSRRRKWNPHGRSLHGNRGPLFHHRQDLLAGGSHGNVTPSARLSCSESRIQRLRGQHVGISPKSTGVPSCHCSSQNTRANAAAHDSLASCTPCFAHLCFFRGGEAYTLGHRDCRATLALSIPPFLVGDRRQEPRRQRHN